MISWFAKAVLLTVLGAPATAAPGTEVFVPVLSYRTGPYSQNGIPVSDGLSDYLSLVNARDGGVNGVKIVFEECEFGYATQRGIDCYQRLRRKQPVVMFPFSTDVTYALTEKAPVDKIPLMTIGYGRSDSAVGSVFPWNFPLAGTYYSAADILIQHLEKLEQGNLKGKRIAFVYHDSSYGQDPLPALEAHAKAKGFELMKLPVTHPGVEQGRTWLQIRKDQPDYVLVWGWGMMNSAAIRSAVSVGYPRSRMYGVWWSAAEPDVAPAGPGAVGFNGLALQHSDERDNPVHRDIVKYVYDGAAKERIGSVLYNRGLVMAMYTVEAIRTAQRKFGNSAVTGEQVRWGFENLDIDAARIAALGFEGMVQPLKTSCADHQGAYTARIHTWDGKEWHYSSDLYEANRVFIRTIAEASAKQYAAEKNIQPRGC